MQLSLIFALIFALIVAFFAIQNTTVVTIQFLFWQSELSLVLVILGSVAAGALLLFFINLIKQYSNHREKKSLKQDNDRLQKEIKTLHDKIESLEAEKKCQTAAVQAQDTNQTALEADQVQDDPNV